MWAPIRVACKSWKRGMEEKKEDDKERKKEEGEEEVRRAIPFQHDFHRTTKERNASHRRSRRTTNDPSVSLFPAALQTSSSIQIPRFHSNYVERISS